MRDQPSLEQIGQLPVSPPTIIPADYLDEMGHMNVMWYTFLFSQAVRQLLEQVGFDAAYIATHRAGTFAMEKHIRYLAEVRVGDQVSVYSRIVARGGSRFHLVQYLVNDTHQRLAAIMETVSTHVDLVARRSAPMPPEIAKKIDVLATRHQALDWEPSCCGIMGVQT